jgi:membrane protein insertase Oxa1/YidC/SpoIIIJ
VPVIQHLHNSSAESAAAAVASDPVLVQGPLTLDQAAQPAADIAFRTVPVPVLVGPASDGTVAAVDAVAGASTLDEISAAASAASATVAAAKSDTAGGFFFGKPMALLETVLTSVHNDLGLPWYATIAVTTASARLAFVPLQIYQSKSIARMSAIRPQMDELTAQMKEASQRGTEKGFEDAEKYRRQLGTLLAKNNVKPWMTMVGALGQLPLWLTFFFTLRHITRPGAGLGLETGGFAWFTDLTEKDPYYALPILCGGSFYAMVQLGDAGQASGAQVDERVSAPHERLFLSPISRPRPRPSSRHARSSVLFALRASLYLSPYPIASSPPPFPAFVATHLYPDYPLIYGRPSCLPDKDDENLYEGHRRADGTSDCVVPERSLRVLDLDELHRHHADDDLAPATDPSSGWHAPAAWERTRRGAPWHVPRAGSGRDAGNRAEH